MRIERAKIYHLNIPFKVNFVHAMASRSYSDSVIIMVEGNGFKGYGEAVVRDYVSGTLGGEQSLLNNVQKAARKFIGPFKDSEFDITNLKSFSEGLKPENSHLPILCAVETAIIDTLCKEAGKDIYKLLGTEPLRNTITYGGTLPILPLKAAEQLLVNFKQLGLINLRIKLDNNIEYTRQILKKARLILGNHFDLRVDANASWNWESALSNLKICREYGVFIIEEPFGRDNKFLSKLISSSQTEDFHFVADESALTTEDIDRAKKNKSFDMINIRLSKNGGLFKSLLLAERAEKYSIRYQVGCHVGETGILSSLGRVLASLVKKPVYTDGSYDEYLLSDNITKTNCTFGPGGRASVIRGKGLGFEISEEKLRRFSVESSGYF